MKAIRNSDGKIIDVEIHGLNSKNCPISYHTNFKDFYKPEDLDFNVVETKDVGTTEKPFDWQSFRAEAAKDILCAMIRRHDYRIDDVCEGIDKAICVADTLISKLKEKEEK